MIYIQDLTNITHGEKVEFKVAGRLKDGTKFEGTDTIKIMSKGKFPSLSFLLANLHGVLSQLAELLRGL